MPTKRPFHCPYCSEPVSHKKKLAAYTEGSAACSACALHYGTGHFWQSSYLLYYVLFTIWICRTIFELNIHWLVAIPLWFFGFYAAIRLAPLEKTHQIED